MDWLKELSVPDLSFREPEPPPAIGADAELFSTYQRLCRETRAVCAADEALMRSRTPENRAALESAEGAVAATRRCFMTIPARTIAGVLLKLEYSRAGHGVDLLEDGTPRDELGFLCSAIADLNAIAAAVPELA